MIRNLWDGSKEYYCTTLYGNELFISNKPNSKGAYEINMRNMNAKAVYSALEHRGCILFEIEPFDSFIKAVRYLKANRDWIY